MDRAHVMALSTEHQDSLWLLLYNLHGMFILEQLQRTYLDGAEADTKHRHALIMSNLDECLEIMNTIHEVRKGTRKTRTFFFSPKAIGVINMAVKVYDPEHSTLNNGDHADVRKAFGTLKDLVAQSAQFCYTREELRKAGIK